MVEALFLTKYTRQGASSRYRSLQYLPLFEKSGIQCTHRPLFPKKYIEKLYKDGVRPKSSIITGYLRRLLDLTKVPKFDIVIIEKELLPYFPAAFEKLLQYSDVPFIVDFDDAIFHNYDLSSHCVVRKTLGSKIDKVMKFADVVVVGNRYLARRAYTADATRVEVIPTVIDINRYPSSPSLNTDKFTIGWIGTPATSDYVENLTTVLRRICDEINCQVVLVGSGSVNMPGVPVEVKDWSEETEIQEIQGFDVGIMPLEDSPWERGKCGLKLIQYMGCAKPVIGSPVGINTRLISNGENGFLADKPEHWENQLKRLANNPSLRTELGENGRRLVKEEFSLQSAYPHWREIIKETTSKN